MFPCTDLSCPAADQALPKRLLHTVPLSVLFWLDFDPETGATTVQEAASELCEPTPSMSLVCPSPVPPSDLSTAICGGQAKQMLSADVDTPFCNHLVFVSDQITGANSGKHMICFPNQPMTTFECIFSQPVPQSLSLVQDTKHTAACGYLIQI